MTYGILMELYITNQVEVLHA